MFKINDFGGLMIITIEGVNSECQYIMYKKWTLMDRSTNLCTTEEYRCL